MWRHYIQEEDFPLLKPEQYSDELCDCGSGLVKSKEPRRKNTMYHHEESNWTEPCCDACFADVWNYYQERWDDYYAGLF